MLFTIKRFDNERKLVITFKIVHAIYPYRFVVNCLIRKVIHLRYLTFTSGRTKNNFSIKARQKSNRFHIIWSLKGVNLFFLHRMYLWQRLDWCYN